MHTAEGRRATGFRGSSHEAMALLPWFRQDTSNSTQATAQLPYPPAGTLPLVKSALTYIVAMLLFAAGLLVSILTVASWL